MLYASRTSPLWLLLLATGLPALAQTPTRVFGSLSLFQTRAGNFNGTPRIAALKGGVPRKSVRRQVIPRPSVAPIPFGAAYTNTTGHRVYFHYQLAGHEYGTIPTGGYTSQAAYLQDVTEAASIGADGFSIDVQSLDQGNQDELTRFFAAANEYNAQHPAPAGSVTPTFTLFLTIDCATVSEAPAPLAALFLRFARDSAYTRVKDGKGNLRPRFSTYAGAGGGWAVVKNVWGQTLALIRAGGINPYFIPGFEETNPAGNGNPSSDAEWVRGLLVGLADGDWEFAGNYGPLGSPHYPSPLPGQQAKTASVQAAGLYREASVRNQAWATGSRPRFYNEYCGGEGLDAWWTSIITVQKPKSVQILTWNDYDEASWTTNANEGPGSPWPYLLHSPVPGFYPSRLGLQNLYRYYVQWYKTGQKPVITHDTLVAEYRPQTGAASAAPTTDPLGGIVYSQDDTGDGPGMSHAPDVVWLDCFLTQGAAVTLTQDDGHSVTRSAPRGHAHLRLPFVAGGVTLTVSRGGRTVLTLTGQRIAGTAAVADANYYSGTAHN